MRTVFCALLLLAPIFVSAQELEIAASISFTEGPATDREGNVYFTDIAAARILKLSADGVLSTFRENSNAANGLLVDERGRLVACEMGRFTRPGVSVEGMPRVTRTDLNSGRIEVLADSYEGEPLGGPNDVTMDGRGRLGFSERARPTRLASRH